MGIGGFSITTVNDDFLPVIFDKNAIKSRGFLFNRTKKGADWRLWILCNIYPPLWWSGCKLKCLFGFFCQGSKTGFVEYR